MCTLWQFKLTLLFLTSFRTATYSSRVVISFLSLPHSLFPSPSAPEAVEGVQVFLFRPNTDRTVVTGLVFWNEMNAQNYTVQVSQQEGSPLPDVCNTKVCETLFMILDFFCSCLFRSTLIPRMSSCSGIFLG